MYTTPTITKTLKIYVQVRKTLAYRVKESVRALAICHNVTPVNDNDETAEEGQEKGEGDINPSEYNVTCHVLSCHVVPCH